MKCDQRIEANKSGIPLGMLVVSLISGLVVLLCCLCCFFVLCKRKKRSKNKNRREDVQLIDVKERLTYFVIYISYIYENLYRYKYDFYKYE